MLAPWRQIHIQTLKNNWNVSLNLPQLLLEVWLHGLLGFTHKRCTNIQSRWPGDSHFTRRKHYRNIRIAPFGEISILRHVLLLIGRDRPYTKVVDFLVYVVLNVAPLAAPLRLQDSIGPARALDCSTIRIYGL